MLYLVNKTISKILNVDRNVSILLLFIYLKNLLLICSAFGIPYSGILGQFALQDCSNGRNYLAASRYFFQIQKCHLSFSSVSVQDPVSAVSGIHGDPPTLAPNYLI